MSYEQTEYQINDRLSFMRILGISLSDRVLDANTIWDFESTLAQAGVMAELFCMFDAMLEEGLITHKGTIIDASFVDAPRQRNHHDENKTLKEGNITEERKKPENDHKLSQKNTDAALHDSQRYTELLEKTDKTLYADSAYSGAVIANNLPEECENPICEKRV